MKMEGNGYKGKLFSIKRDLQKKLGDLPDHEIEKAKGDLKEISAVIHKKYVEAQDESMQRLDQILKKFDKKENSTLSQIKKKTKTS